MSTKIEWTNETWNPIVGCSKVSEGCQNCYAERMAKRLVAMGQKQYDRVVDQNGWTGEAELIIGSMLEKPGTWKHPRRVFVCSMSDLFFEGISNAAINTVMDAIRTYNHHTYQILTKRAKRMAEYFKTHEVPANVWLGVTAENQRTADERIPLLLQIPAKVRFVSVEPMLEAVDLTRIKWAKIPIDQKNYTYGAPAPDEMWSVRNALQSRPGDEYNKPLLGIDWAICGGETGPGARPMRPDWARSLRDQCVEAGVPFFFKSFGEWKPLFSADEADSYPQFAMHEWDDGMRTVRSGKSIAGRELDGKTWEQFPEVKEFSVYPVQCPPSVNLKGVFHP